MCLFWGLIASCKYDGCCVCLFGRLSALIAEFFKWLIWVNPSTRAIMWICRKFQLLQKMDTFCPDMTEKYTDHLVCTQFWFVGHITILLASPSWYSANSSTMRQFCVAARCSASQLCRWWNKMAVVCFCRSADFQMFVCIGSWKTFTASRQTLCKSCAFVSSYE